MELKNHSSIRLAQMTHFLTITVVKLTLAEKNGTQRSLS